MSAISGPFSLECGVNRRERVDRSRQSLFEDGQEASRPYRAAEFLVNELRPGGPHRPPAPGVAQPT